MTILNGIKKISSNIGSLLSRNSVTVSLGKQFLRYGRDAMQSDWSEVQMTDQDHYTGYSFAAINNRASTVANIAKDNIIVEGRTKSAKHPYLPLFQKSTNFSEFWFWYYLSVFLDLEGVAYIMVLRNQTRSKSVTSPIKYMKLLNPYEITRILNKETLEVEGYVERRNGRQRELPAHMIIEIRELNPFSSERAFARSDAAKESQFTLKTGGEYTRSSLRNNINAPGIMSTGVILPDEQFKNFQARIKGHKRGEPVFGNGEGAINWTDMQLDLNKAALKDVTEQNRQSLFAVYGMSKTTMGIEESGTTRETARVQMGLLLDMHIIPRIQLIIDALNLDYMVNYPQEFEATQVQIGVNNPNKQDKDAEKTELDVKQGQFDLYDDLIAQGYDPKIAAKFVKGEIDIAGLGEPTNEPREQPQSVSLPIPSSKRSKKKDSLDHGHDHYPTLSKNQMDVIRSQEAVLENSVINIDTFLFNKALTRVEKLFKNSVTNAIGEKDLITATDKRLYANELRETLDKFYNVVFALEGEAHMGAREKELGLEGDFSMDKNIRAIIDDLSDKVSGSHIDTISNDIYQTVREAALAEKSQQAIIADLKRKYSGLITTTRARTISRTETQRAFRYSQLQADLQLAKQNGFIDRAYKQWRTRSDNPCPICIQLASEPAVPLDMNFRSIGSDVKYSEDGKRKTYKINFTDLEAGNAHPNCWCDYDLIIKREKES